MVRRIWIPVTIMLLFIALRSYHIGAPLLDHSDWRQSDTASITRFYYLDGINLLRPQVLYDGPGPNYIQAEFPIGEALTAELAHVVGWSNTLLHSVAIGLSAISLIALYLLLHQEFGASVAAWGALFYALSPLAIFFGRAVQPEPAMMCFGLLALWLFSAWAHRPSGGRLLLACLAFALAILAKLPNAILGLPILFFLLRRFSWKRPGQWVWPLGLPYIPAILYTAAAGLGATGQGDFVTRILIALFTQPGWQEGTSAITAFWRHNLLAGVAGWGMALAAPLGLLVCDRRGRIWMAAWGFALLIWCVVVVSRIRQDYYLLICVPWFAATAGIAMEWLWRTKRAVLAPIASVVAVGLIVLSAVQFLPPLYRLDEGTQVLAQAMDRVCPSGPVVVGTENPALLYAAWRHGWRTSVVGARSLGAWLAEGATLVVPLGASITREGQAWLTTHARRLTDSEGSVLYVLDDCRTTTA